LIGAVNQTGMKASAQKTDDASSPSKNWHLRLTALSGLCLEIGLILHHGDSSGIFGKGILLLAVLSSSWFVAPKAWFGFKAVFS
jgi:hypothetical protein